jgi:hypothetical protein
MECCRDGRPSRRISHLHRGTLELCQSDHWVLGHLPEEGPSPLIAQFGRVASSRTSLGGSKLYPFKNDGGHTVLGDLQCSRNVLEHFPRSVPQHNPVSDIYGQLFDLMAWFSLWLALPTVGPYIDRCVPFQSCRNISRMINWNRMYLSSVCSFLAKGLNTYVTKVFLFWIFYELANISEPVFALSLCVDCWGFVFI